MAEALFNAKAPPGWWAGSAGTEPAAEVRPEAIAVMREIGIDISGHRPKHLRDALGSDVALVIGPLPGRGLPGRPGCAQRGMAAAGSGRLHRSRRVPAAARRAPAPRRRAHNTLADCRMTTVW